MPDASTNHSWNETFSPELGPPVGHGWHWLPARSTRGERPPLDISRLRFYAGYQGSGSDIPILVVPEGVDDRSQTGDMLYAVLHRFDKIYHVLGKICHIRPSNDCDS